MNSFTIVVIVVFVITVFGVVDIHHHHHQDRHRYIIVVSVRPTRMLQQTEPFGARNALWTTFAWVTPWATSVACERQDHSRRCFCMGCSSLYSLPASYCILV